MEKMPGMMAKIGIANGRTEVRVIFPQPAQ